MSAVVNPPTNPQIAGLDPELLGDILAAGTPVRRSMGTDLTVTDQLGEQTALVLSGVIEVIRGGRVLSELEPGDLLGDLRALAPAAEPSRCIAATDVDFVVFGDMSLPVLLHRFPRLAAIATGRA